MTQSREAEEVVIQSHQPVEAEWGSKRRRKDVIQ